VALLMRAGGLLNKSSRLPQGLLETTRLKDANQVGITYEARIYISCCRISFLQHLLLIILPACCCPEQEEAADAVIQSVEFHPNGQLLLAAGLDKRLRLFNVDGVQNPKVQSVFFQDMPIHHAAFTNGGAQVVAAGRRKFFYVLDLNAAKIEKVTGVFGREERSLESFAAHPDAEGGWMG